MVEYKWAVVSSFGSFYIAPAIGLALLFGGVAGLVTLASPKPSGAGHTIVRSPDLPH